MGNWIVFLKIHLASPSPALNLRFQQQEVLGDITPFDYNIYSSITPIKNPLVKLSKINGVEFDWKPTTEEEKRLVHANEGHDIGVIAQEIEKVIPEIVETREKSGYKAVKYEKIVPLLIEAIKELKQEVDELKKQIK